MRPQHNRNFARKGLGHHLCSSPAFGADGLLERITGHIRSFRGMIPVSSTSFQSPFHRGSLQ
jgi:hypothetical protein